MEAHARDAYGFRVRPEHLQRYREYTSIYKEEEEERSRKWADFLNRAAEEVDSSGCTSSGEDEEVKSDKGVRKWARIRPELGFIARAMSSRVAKRGNDGEDAGEIFQVKQATDVDKTDANRPVRSGDEFRFHWKEELESLVHGGLPVALRGELWQAFVGVEARRVKGYYYKLSGLENDENNEGSDSIAPSNSGKSTDCKTATAPEKWKSQIEKDIPRTFPGHAALDQDGRSALRRVLVAYARHNPSVGYCQAMNFFAGLLLLLMPEENAFWTLVGIIDDYFDGYYTEEMIDSQVDQLAFEELVHEKFPKLANHLNYLGVQVAWITGPWFLSIFINVLPWESVLRVWDVLLFEGSRAILFRTTLALMDLYGPTLLTTKDAADALTLLQSLAGSTFDSSQLVLTACMGYYQAVNENRLQKFRKKHRQSIVTAVTATEEKLHALHACAGYEGLVSKMHSFKSGRNIKDGQFAIDSNRDLDRFYAYPVNIITGLKRGMKDESISELKKQVIWRKVELSKLLEEKRLSIIRAEELETALMEMVKQDNRRILSAKVEKLEHQVSELRQTLAVKQEQESAMIQDLLRLEQEQKATEDARLCAEQDAIAQKYAVQMLQVKFEETEILLAEMEKRAVLAESMLEATLQYQSYQEETIRTQSSSPRVMKQEQELADDPTLLSKPSEIGRHDVNKSSVPSRESGIQTQTQSSDLSRESGIQTQTSARESVESENNTLSNSEDDNTSTGLNIGVDSDN